jgi:hypothetical protein
VLWWPLGGCRYYTASCMTDQLAALELLADEDSPARAEALQHFQDTYHGQPLAMLNWLYVQVRANGSAEHGQLQGSLYLRRCRSASVCPALMDCLGLSSEMSTWRHGMRNPLSCIRDQPAGS